jgi:hypothetical protein
MSYLLEVFIGEGLIFKLLCILDCENLSAANVISSSLL